MKDWSELPDEIVCSVSNHLSFLDRRNLSMVNRRCQQIINAKRETYAGVIVRGVPAINYYYIDIAFDDGTRLRKEFSSVYCGTTDVNTVFTDYANPYGSSHTRRFRDVNPHQLMTTYLKAILQRSAVDNLYVGLLDVTLLLNSVDCRLDNIVLPEGHGVEDVAQTISSRIARSIKVS